MEMKTNKTKLFLNGFETIVRIEAFAHYEQMLHISQCFQMSSSNEILKSL